MSYIDSYKEAFLHLPEGAVEAEVNAETHEITEITVDNGKVAEMQCSSQTVLFVRVSGEKTGYVYTEDLSENAEEVLKKAYENSFCSDRTLPDVMNRIDESRCFEEKEAIMDPYELEQYAAAMEKGLLENTKVISSVHVSLKAETLAQRTINSHGMDRSFKIPVYLMRVNANASDGKNMYSFARQTSASDPSGFSVEEYKKVMEDGLRRQMNPAPGFVSGEYPVVFAAQVVRNILTTAWQTFSGYKYADGATSLHDLLGEQIAGEMVNITDYPSIPGSGFKFHCDCEGSEGIPAKLIENGKFVGVMNNLASADKLGAVSTGNAGRRPLLFGNKATDILVTPKNFVIEPGTSSQQELIEHMGNGILIAESYDVFHTINISSGDYSIPCKGIMIRDGKEAEAVASINIAGNIRELLADIVEVGSDLYLSPMEDLENYVLGACSLRLAKCRVSGE